ncbi:MAG: glycosyltransferase [Mongoliibacter sp.]|uniref:glycosyltransferase family 4 protein n=1 Tax=Mongoliibacter sp. TaxID=2022438 RepID=UPI0012F43D96|nr:glycosyltransferase family 4 protein [Mongoliibacter sp.]TVP45037.1 MAG: glycosyltransferase [Mongoliibacter sp.]
MQKIKILYLVSTLERKGPTNQLLYLIKNLDSNMFEAKVLTLSKEPENSMQVEFEKSGIPVETLGTGRFSGLLKNKKILKKYLEVYQPSVIQSMGIRADAYNATFDEKYFRLTTSRNFPPEDYVKKFGKFKGGLMAKKQLGYFKKLAVVSCSQSIFNQLSQVGITSEVIQNGVDLDLYTPTKRRYHENNGIKEAGLFVTVGSLISRKNTKTIVEAFNLLGPRFHLLVVGEGPELDMLKHLSENENISFLGNSNQVNDLLIQADCFISASSAEGLPNAVLEALSCDLPVILSDIEPHREIVEKSIYEKLIFNAFKPEALKEKILEFLKNRDSFLGQGRDLVSSKFSATQMSKKYQELYLKKWPQDTHRKKG